ncbi:MAG: hypothetical protein AAF737_04355 [Pseudomonadota bacterium]
MATLDFGNHRVQNVLSEKELTVIIYIGVYKLGSHEMKVRLHVSRQCGAAKISPGFVSTSNSMWTLWAMKLAESKGGAGVSNLQSSQEAPLNLLQHRGINARFQKGSRQWQVDAA